jgi:hypothetical protein
VITDHQLAWMKEFLEGLCETPEERGQVKEIVDTFRKLWVIAKASKHNPYARSPRLSEALAAIEPPARIGTPGVGSL